MEKGKNRTGQEGMSTEAAHRKTDVRRGKAKGRAQMRGKTWQEQSAGRRPGNKRAASARRARRRRIVFGVEIALVLVLAAGLFLYAMVQKNLDKINRIRVDLEQVQVNEGLDANLQAQEHLSGCRTIAVVGVDSRDESTERGNSDTMMIVVLDHDREMIRIVSIYRDTYLNIGDDTYTKCNAAYMRGGAEQFLSMLNTNMDLSITDFVTVDFSAVIDVIDSLGGIEMTLTQDEVIMMNDYCQGTSKISGRPYEAIMPEEAGAYQLTGIQAASYMRIRYGEGYEFRRTLRQRAVLGKLLERLKEADLGTLYEVLDKVLPNIATNISKQDIIDLALAARGYEIEGTSGFPTAHMWGGVVKERMDGLDCIVPVTLEYNVEALHRFLYPDLAYTPTETVRRYSAYISEASGYTQEDIPSSSEDGGEMPQ